MNNSYITIIKEKRTDLSRKRIPLNQNGCTADFRMSVPFEQNLHSLEKAIGDSKEENSNLDMFSLEMFENIAYIMAKHADSSISDTPEEWLDNFNTFSIYQVLPQLIKLWGLNVKSDVEAQKNFAQLKGK